MNKTKFGISTIPIIIAIIIFGSIPTINPDLGTALNLMIVGMVLVFTTLGLFFWARLDDVNEPQEGISN